MADTMDRRDFLCTLATLAALGPVRAAQRASSPRTRVVLLGTGGGPRPRPGSNPAANVVSVDGRLYVVDAGDGVAKQLVTAGFPLDAIGNVFITHHHSDHDADYGNLLLLAWASGLRSRVDTWGPPPMERITQLFLEMSADDIAVRIADEGRPPLAPLIHAHDVMVPGEVMRDDLVRVTAAVVPHPMVKTALAYRIDTPDRSVVFSGDTARSDAVIELARGADILVHEAMWPEAAARLASRVSSAKTLLPHLLASHTSAEDCGRIAAAAGVKTLVLSHFVPADDPLVTESMWLDAARRHFSGQVIVGRDLLEI